MKVSSLSYVKPSYTTTFDHKKIHLFYCLTLLHNTEVRGFRILGGKPVNGQKTNCNAKTTKNNLHPLYSFKYKVMSSLVQSPLSKPNFLAEYISLFWQHQWVFEWVSNYRAVRHLPIYVRKTNFIDIAGLNRYHIYHSYKNPFKSKPKKSQKRKKVVPKNKYTSGLPFGFSITYAKQLAIIN